MLSTSLNGAPIYNFFLIANLRESATHCFKVNYKTAETAQRTTADTIVIKRQLFSTCKQAPGVVLKQMQKDFSLQVLRRQLHRTGNIKL